MAEVLATKDLSIHFGGLKVFNGINFFLKSGEVKALIGPNGAGKTTFFNLICGNLKPSGGRIFFQKKDITGLSPHKISRMGISRTYQKTNLFPTLSVKENIRLGAQNAFNTHLNPIRNINKIPLVNEKVEELLELVGFQNKANDIIMNLSHGDQRLVEIAIGLSTKPELLLLDEPTAGLSVKETRDMVTKVKQLARKSIPNMILVEHDMEVVKEVADSICVLANGEIICDGSFDDVNRNPKVREAYWGV
jgi:branched-chain amino acid transport system ATP-binding protein